MTENTAEPRYSTRNRELGRYVPRRFNPDTRERFLRDRRRRYLARLTGPPSDRQAAQIDSLCRLEWSALACEADGGLPALRDAREHRRLFDRLLADFERSLIAPARQPTVDDHLAAIRAQFEGSR